MLDPFPKSNVHCIAVSGRLLEQRTGRRRQPNASGQRTPQPHTSKLTLLVVLQIPWPEPLAVADSSWPHLHMLRVQPDSITSAGKNRFSSCPLCGCDWAAEMGGEHSPGLSWPPGAKHYEDGNR